jgi:hypothetical protein
MIELLKFLNTMPGDRLLGYFIMFGAGFFIITICLTDIILAIKERRK